MCVSQGLHQQREDSSERKGCGCLLQRPTAGRKAGAGCSGAGAPLSARPLGALSVKL